jgi:hypothetical protein
MPTRWLCEVRNLEISKSQALAWTCRRFKVLFRRHFISGSPPCKHRPQLWLASPLLTSLVGQRLTSDAALIILCYNGGLLRHKCSLKDVEDSVGATWLCCKTYVRLWGKCDHICSRTSNFCLRVVFFVYRSYMPNSNMASSLPSLFLLAAAPLASAQYGFGGYGGSGGGYNGNPYNGGGSNNNGNGGSAGQFGGPSQSFIDSRQKILIAHGVLGALAFVLLFPIGSILIRLGTFRGVWLVHGIFQLLAYIVYIVAFGLGVWMVNNIPYNLLDTYHPIIGIVLFVLLFFQPILGYIHHVQYKKYSRRTVWSYGHVWLGRIVITLGMINGGLGMLLASDAPAFLSFRPTKGQTIAYGVIAGIMWLAWAAAAIVGERRRAKASKAAKEAEVEDGSPPPYRGHKSRFA